MSHQYSEGTLQRSESFLLAAFLAIAGGFLDAYTYQVRGKVFANAQTGNIVLLGMNLAERKWGSALYYTVPILAFFLGIILAEWIRKHCQEKTRLHWRQLVIALEILLLSISAFLPCGRWDVVVNVCVSFVCALQVESFRKIRGNAYASTMCTGNLRSGTDYLYQAIEKKSRPLLKKSLQYYGIILFFIFGAAMGTLLTGLFSGRSILFAAGILTVPWILMFF